MAMRHIGGLAGAAAGMMLALALGVPQTAFGAVTAAEIEQAVAAAAKYDEGQSTKPLRALEKLINDTYGRPELRAQIERRLAGVLESDAPLAAKQALCRILWMTGTDASVPALAKMLAGSDPHAAEIACYALSRHPAPAVGAALREALSRANGSARIAIVTLLGDRRDSEGAEAIAALAQGPDAPVSDAAVAALGKIATEAAVKALLDLHKGPDAARSAAAGHALLQAGQELAARGKPADAKAIYEQLSGPAEPLHIRRGALLGRINLGGHDAVNLVLEAVRGKDDGLKAAAIATLRTMPGPNVGGRFAEALFELAPKEQQLVIGALADRRDASVRPAITGAAGHSDAAVRIEAIKALGVIGEAASVPVLLKAYAGASTAEREVAGLSLRMLKADGADAAILEAMKSARGGLRADLMGILTDRRWAGAVPALLAEAAGTDANVAKAAFGALAVLAEAKDLPALVGLLVELKTEEARPEAERAAGQVARKAADLDASSNILLRAADTARETPVRCSLLRVLGGIATEPSYKALVKAASDGRPEIQDTAIRVLAEWPDVRAVDQLLKMLQASANDTHRTLLVRGCVRLLGRVQGPPAEIVKKYAQAMARARRPDEKRLVLSGLARVPHADALKMAADAIEDTQVQAEAALAAIAIARDLTGSETEAVNAAMKKVAGGVEDASLRAQAQGLIRRPPPPLPDVYLDAMTPAKAISGNNDGRGPVQINKNCIGAPLRLKSMTYARGIGEHAKADLEYPLKPEYRRFVCVAGLDDQVARYNDVRGSIVVKTYVDEKLLAETPVLRGGGASCNIDVEIPGGAKTLRLVVDDAGDGVAFDDADFVNAGFIFDPAARPRQAR